MEHQRVRAAETKGHLDHYYEDRGPGRAVPGYGRSLLAIVAPAESPAHNMTVSGGGRQASGLGSRE